MKDLLEKLVKLSLAKTYQMDSTTLWDFNYDADIAARVVRTKVLKVACELLAESEERQ